MGAEVAARMIFDFNQGTLGDVNSARMTVKGIPHDGIREVVNKESQRYGSQQHLSD
jgi:hypothetical protein